jgi:hypothetical protein
MKKFTLALLYILAIFLIKSRFNISFTFPFAINFALFMLGGTIGFLLFYLNFFLYPFLSEKSDPLAQKADEYFQKKDFLLGIKFLELNQGQMVFQILKSAITLVALLIITWFVYISSGSLLGAGVGFGLLFHLCLELVSDLNKPENLNKWFSQIKRPIEYKYQQYFVYAIIGLTILISL